MNDSPLVSVIVVNLNNLHLLKKCLASLASQDYKRLEIIVIDNRSEEDITELVAECYPEARLVCLEKNHGFAAGNNIGIKIANGDYIALINNDAVASPNWISSMVEVAERYPDSGAIASIIVDGNDSLVVDSLGMGITFDGMSRQRMKGAHLPKITQPVEVLVPSGCACMLRISALREVGFFDEDFFAYCEDTDLGLRLRVAGWRILLAPNSVVGHFYSMTGGSFSLNKIYWVERNHYWVAVKNFPLLLLIFLPLFTGIRFLLQVFLFIKGDSSVRAFKKENSTWQLLTISIKALLDMLKLLPKMLKKRMALRKYRRLNTLEMILLLWRFRIPMVEVISGGMNHASERTPKNRKNFIST